MNVRLRLAGDLTESLGQAEFFLEAESREIAHALRVEYAVEMIALVLHQPGVKIFRFTFEAATLGIVATIAYSTVARHDAAQAGNAQATLPTIYDFVVRKIELGIDENRARRRASLPSNAQSIPRDSDECSFTPGRRSHRVAGPG